MCAWKKPFSAPQAVGAKPAWGECGSPSWSESAWCLRWSVTHCVTGPCSVIEPRIAKVARTVPVVSKLRWVNSRW